VLDLMADPSVLGVEGLDLAGDTHAGVVEPSLMLHIILICFSGVLMVGIGPCGSTTTLK
jgi:hypothetical protein